MTTPAETQPPRIKPLAAAETAVRRMLLMVGFGFLAFVGGSVLGSSLGNRLVPRLEGASETVGTVVWFLIQGSWVMVVLPAIGWIAGRFLDLKPWPTAIIGAGTGLTFQFALQYVSVGSEGISAEPMRQVLRLGAAGFGIVLTAFAVRRARELARVAEDQAKVEAEKKKSQYDEFVRDAEKLAERREQVPIAPQQPAAEPVAAPVAEPAPAAEPPPAAPPPSEPKP